ncbi:unnamed protein product [Cylindrotheca closterium]|uniref:Uncharacterized protein n=1 Tax=Cylindrotheca closterium TaxID=2856 RepID=A0AAD2FHG3_9STRA|nr:unnamed protein product [Cylindrotheca closterium]
MDVDGTDPSICSRPSGKRLHPATRFTKPATQEPAKLRPTMNAPGAKRRSQRTLTLEERLDDLRNVDQDGMEELGMVYNYSGQQDGNQSHVSIILQHILDTLSDMFRNTEETFRILPLSARTYKNMQMWIRNEANLWRLIPDYRGLSRYLSNRHERTYIPVTKQMRQKEPRLIYMYWVDHFGEENPIKVYEPGETYLERKKRLEAKHDKRKKNLHERMTTAEINAGEQSTLTDCFFLPKKKKRT